MKRSGRLWRQTVAVLAAAVVLTAAWGSVASADLSISTRTTVSMPGMPSFPGFDDLMGGDDGGETLFMRDHRVAMVQPGVEHFIIDCASGEFAIVSHEAQAYWQGTMDEFVAEMEEVMAQTMGMAGDEFGQSFGGGSAAGVAVRTIRVGAETVAGYETVHYRVEYEADGHWTTFEDVWVAPALLRQVESEVGSCLHTVVSEVQLGLAGLAVGMMGDDPSLAVVASPQYLALMDEGYPVRSESSVETFGLRMETVTELLEVDTGALDPALFEVPDHYRRLSFLEAMMSGGM